MLFSTDYLKAITFKITRFSSMEDNVYSVIIKSYICLYVITSLEQNY